MKVLWTRRAPANAPVGKLSIDGTVALRHNQARRPPAVTGSNRPMILLAEKRESMLVVMRKVLEATGYDVIVVARASEALYIGVACEEHIDFLITEVAFTGINGGLLAHLFQCVHPETRALFLSGSPEEVLICPGALDQRIAVLQRPVRLDVFASKVSEMIATRQVNRQAAGHREAAMETKRPDTVY